MLHHHIQRTTETQPATTRRNSPRIARARTSVWASPWLVTLCAFYRQILSLTYSFCFLKLPPPACPALLVFQLKLQTNTCSIGAFALLSVQCSPHIAIAGLSFPVKCNSLQIQPDKNHHLQIDSLLKPADRTSVLQSMAQRRREA